MIPINRPSSLEEAKEIAIKLGVPLKEVDGGMWVKLSLESEREPIVKSRECCEKTDDKLLYTLGGNRNATESNIKSV